MFDWINKYPYTDFHELNLSYVLSALKDMANTIKDFIAINTLALADPISWDITSQYGKGKIVLDAEGNAYVSIEPVPAGVSLNDTDYWLEIFNYMDYVKSFNSNLTLNSERNTDRATHAYTTGAWIIWNDILYEVTADIAVDDILSVDSNLSRMTVEMFCKAWITQSAQIIEQYKNDIDASELAFTTNLQQQFEQVLAGVTVDSEVINARVGWDGTSYATLKNSIVGQVTQNRNDIIGDTGLYDTSVLVSGSTINANTGAFAANSGYKRTNYIALNANVKEITITTNDVSGFCLVAFYYSDNTYIGRFIATSDNTFKLGVPDTAVKFAVTINNDGSFEVRDVTPTVKDNNVAIANDVRNELLFDQLHVGCDKLQATAINISGYREILLTDLPHNIIEFCSEGGTQNTVTLTFTDDTIRLNGSNTSSFFVNFMFKALPKGVYYILGAVTGRTTIRASGAALAATVYDVGTGATFRVVDDKKPVLIDIGILRDVVYNNEDFLITISPTLDGVIKGPVHKSGFTLYSKDENNNVKEYTINGNTIRLALLSPGAYFNLYTASANILLTGLIPSNDYYLIDSLNKPFDYSGKTALIAGDSIAMGYWNGTTHANYFGKFFKDKAGLSSITNIAVGGAKYYGSTAADVITQLSGVTLSDYDVLIILCGTNDYSQGVSELNFNSALTTISNYINANKSADAQVIILTPNGRTDPAANFNLPLNKYREMITTWALSNEYAVLDGRLLGIPDKDSAYSLTVLHDGIHPNELGHHVIADTMTKLL